VRSHSPWLAPDFELLYEPQWFHPSLSLFITNGAHHHTHRDQLTALLTKECPGGVSLSFLSELFRDMITTRVYHYTTPHHAAATGAAGGHGRDDDDTKMAHDLLNSLHGLPLHDIIPGWHTFMIRTCDVSSVMSCYVSCIHSLSPSHS
jgi:hypothetical protein